MQRLEIETAAGTARADLDRPARPRMLLVLGHGAGGGVDTADLLAVRDTALSAGAAVARVTQPYRVAGRRTPAPAPRLDTAWLAVVEALRQQRGLRTVPLVVGGRSSGARVACRTAAESGAAAVIALAFPVHPPGRPERSRLDELALPGVPILVVQGDRDAFGMPPAAAVTRLVTVAGADHGLKSDPNAVGAAVAQFLGEQQLAQPRAARSQHVGKGG